MDNKKIIILVLGTLVFLSSCQSIKDGLEGKKKSSDEFLVEKKNPLVLPPDFEKLPVPRNKKTDTQVEVNEVQKLFEDNKIVEKESSKNTETENSIEKMIFEKIENN